MRLKISAPASNEEFELLDSSYGISNIQEYFEYLFERHAEKKPVNPINKI